MMGHGMPPPPPAGGRRDGGAGRERPEGGERRARTLEEMAVTVWLTPENAHFERKNGLFYLTLDGKETRVNLCREFPFELSWEYISALDTDGNERGIIRSTALFEGETRNLLEDELRLRYYAPQITSILRVREKYGFSYWTVTTADAGKLTFTVQDPYRTIFRVGEKSVTFTDVDGNRYEIPALAALDRRSRKRVDLYI